MVGTQQAWANLSLRLFRSYPQLGQRESEAGLPPWLVDHLPDDPFKPEFEKRAIVDFEQPVGDVDAEIGVDPDQIGIEGRMVDFETIGCPSGENLTLDTRSPDGSRPLPDNSGRQRADLPEWSLYVFRRVPSIVLGQSGPA